MSDQYGNLNTEHPHAEYRALLHWHTPCQPGSGLIGTGDSSWRNLRDGIKAIKGPINFSRISKFKLSADAVQLKKRAPRPTAKTTLSAQSRIPLAAQLSCSPVFINFEQ